MADKFKWVVEFDVDESWVADGFDLTDERAKEMIERALPYSYASETNAKVLKAPSQRSIMEKQGYTEADIRAATA
jgi:hypothetical protein